MEVSEFKTNNGELRNAYIFQGNFADFITTRSTRFRISVPFWNKYVTKRQHSYTRKSIKCIFKLDKLSFHYIMYI